MDLSQGLIFILLGIILILLEHMVPGFGVFAISGVVSFVVGSVMLINLTNPPFHINWWTILAVAVFDIGFIYGLIRIIVRSRFRSPFTGKEALVGQLGVALEDFEETGEILVVSEKWNASAQMPIKRGQAVKVIAVNGLTLQVEVYSNKQEGG